MIIESTAGIDKYDKKYDKKYKKRSFIINNIIKYTFKFPQCIYTKFLIK